MTDEDDRIKTIISDAERKIQNILLDIQNKNGVYIDYIDVHLRTFANLAVSIGYWKVEEENK